MKVSRIEHFKQEFWKMIYVSMMKNNLLVNEPKKVKKNGTLSILPDCISRSLIGWAGMQ